MTTQNDKKMAVEADRTADIEEVEKPAQAQIHLAYEATDVEPAVSLKTKLAILALGANYLAHSALISTIGPIIAQVNAAVGPDASYTWIVSSKTISTGICALLGGTVSDLLGRRWFMNGGAMLGVVGCIVGSTAQSVPQVIAAMTLCGIAGGASLNAFACVSELVSRKQRGVYFALVNAACLAFTVAGSLIGHAMVKSSGGWRVVFYMECGINVVAVVLGFLYYRPAAPLVLQTTTRRQILRDFDYVGLFGLAAGPVLLLVAIIWLGGAYKFNSPQVLSTFIIGVVLIIALAVYESFVPKNPLLHPKLFKQVRTFTMLLVVTFTSGMLYYSIVTFLPRYLSLGYIGNDLIRVGLYQLPFGSGSNLGGIGIGFLFRYVKHQKWTLVGSVVVQVIFIGLLAVPGPSDLPMAAAFIFFSGLGIGLEQVLSILMVQLSTPDEWIGFATGSLTAFRLIGGSVGTAMYITMFQNEVGSKVPAAIIDAMGDTSLPNSSITALIQSLLTPATGPAIDSIPGITEEIIVIARTALKQGYLNSFKLVWYVATALGVLTLLCAVFIKDMFHRVDNSVAQRLDNEEVKAKKQGGGFEMH